MFVKRFEEMVNTLTDNIQDQHFFTEELREVFEYAVDFLRIPVNVTVPKYNDGEIPTTLLEVFDQVMMWKNAFEELSHLGCMNHTFQPDWREEFEEREVILEFNIRKCGTDGYIETDYGVLKLLNGDRANFQLDNLPIPLPVVEYNWRSALRMAQKINAAIN